MSNELVPRRAPMAWRVVASLAAVKLLLHGLVLAVTEFGVHRDEFLYMSMGAHLRLWRMDFPPLSAMLANLSRALFDQSLAAVRVFPALIGTGILVLAAVIAAELGGRRFAQGLAALCVLCALLFQRSSTLFQPVVVDQLCWTLALYALIRLARTHAPREWLFLGAAMGLGLLAKFSIVFFGVAAVAAIALTPTRKALRTPWPWAAAALALLIGSPSIVGQIALAAPVMDQMKDLQGQQLTQVSWYSFIVAQPRMLSVAPFFVAVVGAIGLLKWRAWKPLRTVGWTCVLAFALLLILRGKAYYIGPIYPTLFAAGAVVLENLAPPQWGKVARRTVVIGTIGFGIFLLPLGVPILSKEATSAYAARIGASQSLRTNQGALDRLPQDYADMIGWPEQSRALAQVVASLDSTERRDAVIFASNYGQAGAAEFYGERYQLPPVVSAAGSFWFFGPGARPGNVLIAIGEDSAGVAKAYDDVRVATVIESPWSVEEERRVPIVIGRKPKQTLQALWPSLSGRN